MIYAVTATAKTPLSLRKGRNNSEAATLDYIPGGALLGALVNAHRMMRPNRSDELESLLFAESTRLNNLYPARLPEMVNETVAMRLELLDDPKLPVYPFPRTAHSCKRFAGFLYDSPAPAEHHGMHDHLAALALFKMSDCQKPALLRDRQQCAFENNSNVPCKESRSPQKQGYYRRGDAAEAWLSFDVKQMLRTHNGISRKRGAVQESILFSRSVLAAGSCFWGTLAVDEAGAVSLKQFIEEAGQAGMVRVGSNRSRGMGRVELRLSTFEPDTKNALAQRLERFNQKLSQTATDYGITLNHTSYVPLTLTADAVLIDHLLRYQTYLDPAYLAEAHGLSGAALVYSNAAAQRVMGWNSLYRLPKADELAVIKGSVFLFGFETAIDDDFLEKLFTLQETGVGLRRREGYGRLLVANPFHWEVDNV